jgi:hypothetical protein
MGKNDRATLTVNVFRQKNHREKYPPDALKSPENPDIPDHIYDLVTNPEGPQPSEPIDIPCANPLARSTIFADLRRRDSKPLRPKRYY